MEDLEADSGEEEFFDAANREENRLDIDLTEEFFGNTPIKLTPILDLNVLNNEANELHNEIVKCEQSVDPKVQDKLYQLLPDFHKLKCDIDYLRVC